MARSTFALLFAAIYFSGTLYPENDARTIITKMLKATDANTGSIYTMHSSERMVHSQEVHVEDIFTKVNVHPLKVYLKIKSGSNAGTEILYVDGENNNKALVNPGKLLPDLHLSPAGTLMMKNEHHTLLNSGFSLVNAIMKFTIKKMDASHSFDSDFKYVGDVIWNGRNCFKMAIEDDSRSYISYVAQPGETMTSIAAKRLISEYTIMEQNDVKNFEEDLQGRTLKLPTVYARKTVLYIDKESYFPIMQEMSDEGGIFERYEYINLVVGPAFKPDEFNRNYPEYSF